MELTHLKGNTYYIDGIVNIGLYKINTHKCILIDSGFSGDSSTQLVKFLKDSELEVKAIINTHAHRDHMGGNYEIIKEFHSLVYAPKFEDTFIKRPDLASLFVYPSAPFSTFENVHIKGCKVNNIIPENGLITINGIKFKTISLAGHSPNQVGIVTPDDVFFTADAYVCKSELEHMKILFSYDLSKDLECKKRMLSMKHAIYLPSHGKPTDNITKDIEDNIKYYNKLISIIESFLSSPKTLDELMKDAIKTFGISSTLSSYMIGRGCLTGILSHMERSSIVEVLIIDDTLKFKIINS